jgi:hypothetical protein
MKAVIISVWPEREESTKNQVEDVMSSVDEQTQDLHEEQREDLRNSCVYKH